MAAAAVRLALPPLHPSSLAFSFRRRSLPQRRPISLAFSSLLLVELARTSPLSARPPPGLMRVPRGGGSIVGDLLDYLNESWTHFHATAEAKRLLLDAGFYLLSENEEWDLKPGGRYFFTRNMSSLVAFAIGEKYDVGNGFHVIAAHTDSPRLKLKPKSASVKLGYLMVNVQIYGGGLWHTWFTGT